MRQRTQLFFIIAKKRRGSISVLSNVAFTNNHPSSKVRTEMISEIMTETEPFHSELSPNTPGHFYPVLAPFAFQICGALPSFISFAETQLRYMRQKTVMTGNEDGINKAQQHCWRSRQEVNWYDRRSKPLWVSLIVSDRENIIALNVANVSPTTTLNTSSFN